VALGGPKAGTTRLPCGSPSMSVLQGREVTLVILVSRAERGLRDSQVSDAFSFLPVRMLRAGIVFGGVCLSVCQYICLPAH